MEEVLRVTPVVGLPQFAGWSQVVERRLDGNRNVVVCLAVEGENAGNIGREMIDHIVHQPPRSAQGLFQVSEELVAKANHLQCKVAFSLGFFRRLRVTLVTHRSSIILHRDLKVGSILQTGNELGLVEGKFRIDDTFVFATRQAEQYLSEIELNFGKGYDADSVITSIVPALHAMDDSSKSALAFISVQAPREQDRPVKSELLSVDIAAHSEGENIVDIKAVPAKQGDAKAAAQNKQLAPSAQHFATTPADIPDNILKKADNDTLDSASPVRASGPSKFSSTILGLKSKTSGFISSIWLRIKLLLNLTKRVFSSKTYVDKSNPTQLRKKIVLGLLLFLLFAALIGFFVFRSQVRQDQTVAIINPIQTQIEELENLANSDPVKARQEMSDLIEQIKTRILAAEESGDGWLSQELGHIQNQAEMALESISGIDEIQELPVFFDLRLVDSDFIATTTQRVGDYLLAVDAEQKILLSLNLDDKQTQVNQLSDLENVKAVAPDLGSQNPQAFLLANGIHRISVDNVSQPEEIKPAGDSNNAATLIGSFASYIYVFNPEKRNIYRYAAEGDGYSDPIGWLVEPLGLSFEEVSSWAIDGEIWLTSQAGEIKRFRSGRVVDFEPTGLEQPFSESLQIVTSEAMENLYIMETAKNRVVVLSKDGQFLREVSNQSIGAATSFVVNAAEDKAFLTSGSTVFSLDL